MNRKVSVKYKIEGDRYTKLIEVVKESKTILIEVDLQHLTDQERSHHTMLLTRAITIEQTLKEREKFGVNWDEKIEATVHVFAKNIHRFIKINSKRHS